MRLRPALCSLWLAATALGQLSTDALFRETLAQANLSPQEVRFDPRLFDYFFRTQDTTPLFEMLLRDPLRLPYYAERLRNSLVGAVGRPVAAVESGASAIGVSVRRTLAGDPLQAARERANAPNALESAVVALYEAAKTPITPAVRQQLQRAQRDAPEAVQREAAFLMYVAIDARRWRDAALRDLTPDEQRALFQLLTLPIKAFEGALELLAHGGRYRCLGSLVERDDGVLQRVRRVRPLPRRLQRVAHQRAPYRDANRARARLHRRHRTPYRPHQAVAQPLGIVRQAQRVAQQHLEQRRRILRAEKVVEQSRVEARLLWAEIRLRERLAKERVGVELTKRGRRKP